MSSHGAGQPLANRSRLREAMAAEGVDALVASTPANVMYVSDYWNLSQWSRAGATTFAVIAAAADEVELVAPLGNADLVAADRVARRPRLSTYGDFVVAGTDSPAGLTREEQAFRDAPGRW
ncbi:MAG: aminopeptidase P family N-terminal domain-containing protein [Solirubrobacteraceae bacterium]